MAAVPDINQVQPLGEVVEDLVDDLRFHRLVVDEILNE